MKHPTAVTAHIGLYIALCVVTGLILAPVPNVELITLMVFLGGYFFGISYGALIGGTSMFIFSALNPWGSGLAYPPLLIAQVISFSITGVCGGLISRIMLLRLPLSARIIIPRIVIFGTCGGLLTLMYHVIAAVSTAEFAGFSLEKMSILIGGGIIFAILNIVTNIAFFAVFIPVLTHAAQRFVFVREFKHLS